MKTLTTILQLSMHYLKKKKKREKERESEKQTRREEAKEEEEEEGAVWPIFPVVCYYYTDSILVNPITTFYSQQKVTVYSILLTVHHGQLRAYTISIWSSAVCVLFFNLYY